MGPRRAGSARRPGHVPAGQHVEMQVEHALPRLLADVGDHPVALQPQLLGDLGNDGEDMSHHSGILRRDLGHRGDMGLGDHQKVGGRLGIDVVEGVAQLILVHLFGRDLAPGDLAEQTVGHGTTSFSFQLFWSDLSCGTLTRLGAAAQPLSFMDTSSSQSPLPRGPRRPASASRASLLLLSLPHPPSLGCGRGPGAMARALSSISGSLPLFPTRQAARGPLPFQMLGRNEFALRGSLTLAGRRLSP